MDILVEQILKCGLSRRDAELWVTKLRELPCPESVNDEKLRWKAITQQLLTPEVPFAAHELLFEQNYQRHRQQGLPCPAWLPSDADIAATHVKDWLHATQLPDYESLHAWSISHVEEFTAKLIEALSIRFTSKSESCRDVSAGLENVRWFPQTTMNIVDSCFHGDENAVAIIAEDEDNRIEFVTYAQLRTAAARVANGILELGLKPGDRVAVSLPMTTDAVAIFLGIIAAGCAVVTIADSFAAEEMALRLDITQPKCVFIQDELIRGGRRHAHYEKIASQQIGAIVLRASHSRQLSLRAGDMDWEDFLSADDTLTCVPRDPADETTILFSSGTTGQPKAIPWEHTTPIKSASDAYFHHDVHPGDILCWPTNLGWMMGPWLVYSALINRASMALSQAIPTSRRFCEFVQDAGVTMLGLVPSIVSEWRLHERTSGLDWSSIRLFSSTGECSNASDMLWLMSRAGYRPVIEYCGGTETGGGYVAGTLTKPAVPGMFSAKAMGFSWLLLNESFEPTSLGEVLFEPPAIGLSTRLLNRDHHEVYFAGIPPGPKQQILRRHGDQVEELPDGYFRARGRIDDAMNLGGIKVSCVQIEELLSEHDAIQELAAISIPLSGGGPERLVICVVLRSAVDMLALQQELQRSLNSRLNPLFKIHAVEPIEKLPRTVSNKIMRRKLREQYMATH